MVNNWKDEEKKSAAASGSKRHVFGR